MERISNFNEFIGESAPESEEFTITKEVIDRLKRDCDFLRSADKNGAIGFIYRFSEEINVLRNTVFPDEPQDDYVNGLALSLNTSEIFNLIEALDEGMYYITPHWFEKKHTNFVFFNDKSLGPGEFSIDQERNLIKSVLNKDRSSKYVRPRNFFLLGDSGDKRHMGIGSYQLYVSLGFNSYPELQKSFEGSIAAISSLFSRVRVMEDKAIKEIPNLLSKEIKPKIKQVYQECVKDFFKTGEIDPELTSLKDVIAEIFKDKKDIIKELGDDPLSKDMMAKVIDSLMNDDEKEIVKLIKTRMKVSKIMKYI